MKIPRRGYRLMPEEEAMLRGESRGEVSESAPASGNNENAAAERKKTSASRRAIRTILPLILFLGLMIGAAYFFFYLVSGSNAGKEATTSATDSLFLSVTREYDAYRFPPLSLEEKLLFIGKLSLTQEEEDAFWPDYYRFADRLGKAEAIHDEWIARLAEGDYRFALPERIMQQYDAFYRTHRSLTESFYQTFSDVLSQDRAPWVFVLHDQIRYERSRNER